MQKQEKEEPTALQRRVEWLESELEKMKNLVSAAKEVLNLEEAAAFMGVTKSFLYKMTHNHAIPFYKPGNKLVYFEKSELLSWLRQNPVMSTSQVSKGADEIISRLGSKL